VSFMTNKWPFFLYHLPPTVFQANFALRRLSTTRISIFPSSFQ
jgi:hypothetical protein